MFLSSGISVDRATKADIRSIASGLTGESALRTDQLSDLLQNYTDWSARNVVSQARLLLTVNACVTQADAG